MHLPQWLRHLFGYRIARGTTFPVQPINKESYKSTMRKGRDALRTDIENDLRKSSEGQRPVKQPQEIARIEFIRAFTLICIMCIIGTWLEPETMSPYLDKLFTLIVFLIGYFFQDPVKEV
jgi:hypothetical protein